MAKPDRHELLESVRDGIRSFSAYAVLFSHAIAERLGLNAADSRCVDLLSQYGPMTSGRLAELTGMTTGAVTGLVDRLERAGFARRESDKTDRRRVIVRVVPEREREAYGQLTSVQADLDQLLAGYDDKELAAIADFLTRATAGTAEQLARLRR